MKTILMRFCSGSCLIFVLSLSAILAIQCGTGNIKVARTYLSAQGHSDQKEFANKLCDIIRKQEQHFFCRSYIKEGQSRESTTINFSGKYLRGIAIIPIKGQVLIREAAPGNFAVQPVFEDSRTIGAQGAQKQFWDKVYAALQNSYAKIDEANYLKRKKQYEEELALQKQRRRKEAQKPQQVDGTDWSRYLGRMTGRKAREICKEKKMRLPYTEELEDLARRKPDWAKIGCEFDSCRFWSSEMADASVGIQKAVAIDSGEVMDLIDTDDNDVRCIALSEAEWKKIHEAELQEKYKKMALSSRTRYRYKLGRIARRYLLRQMRQQAIARGYRGARLAQHMKGAAWGVDIGLRRAIKLDLRRNGIMIIKEGSSERYAPYRIRGSKLYIKAPKDGKFSLFARFQNGRRQLRLFAASGIPNPNPAAVLELY